MSLSVLVLCLRPCLYLSMHMSMSVCSSESAFESASESAFESASKSAFESASLSGFASGFASESASESASEFASYTFLGPIKTTVETNASPTLAAHAQAKLADESARIKNEFEEKLAEMKKMYEQEQSSKEHLQDEMNRLKTEYDKKLSSVENQYPVNMNVVSIGSRSILKNLLFLTNFNFSYNSNVLKRTCFNRRGYFLFKIVRIYTSQS